MMTMDDSLCKIVNLLSLLTLGLNQYTTLRWDQLNYHHAKENDNNKSIAYKLCLGLGIQCGFGGKKREQRRFHDAVMTADQAFKI